MSVVDRLLIGLLCLSAVAFGAADNLGYSPDGGLVSFGEFDYVYDSASRLTEVWSNGVRVVENQYDALGRRVIKRTPEETHTFVYDGWLLVVERIERAGGQLDQLDYWWGKDISGTLDGAGGIGGLLYLRKNGLEVYVPLYDGHDNVIQYVDKQGSIVAEYAYDDAYDAFGNTIRKSGVKADELKMRFSTKYSDDESELYYFGRRFYSPRIARWLSRDPIEEEGGLNLYVACENDMMNHYDALGMYTLGDAYERLASRKVPRTKRVGVSWMYSDSELFDEWLDMERMRGSWWTSLPKCPDRICIKKNGAPANPDKRKWKHPQRMLLNRANHPGGAFEMRSLPVGHSANQCVYDKSGNLMRNQPVAGTVDYYSFPEYWWLHATHDLRTFELARELGRIPDYYSVRPTW